MREAVLIVSPKMENLGSLLPTSPVTCRDKNETGGIKRAIHAYTAIDSVRVASQTYAGPGVDADPDDDMLPVVRHQNLQHPSAAVDNSNQKQPLFSGFKTRGLKNM